ncbi:hypothetical protein NDU88_003941 [Pleurodeles waltl]|uniref:Uncharacterized protein n=1 Tax=Pleurodeles waltl TaxID=8319 RepID=A0AAV7VHE7_PLEWA|nr:hypothetical protein NDU88_003941 [Pleurodeles waltl]
MLFEELRNGLRPKSHIHILNPLYYPGAERVTPGVIPRWGRPVKTGGAAAERLERSLVAARSVWTRPGTLQSFASAEEWTEAGRLRVGLRGGADGGEGSLRCGTPFNRPAAEAPLEHSYCSEGRQLDMCAGPISGKKRRYRTLRGG